MSTILAGLGLWFVGSILAGASWAAYRRDVRRWEERDGWGDTATGSIPRPSRKLDMRGWKVDRRPRDLSGKLIG